jgi:hypothetical protein
MGLDVYLYPMREQLTLEMIKEDEKLEIVEGEMTYIQLRDDKDSKVGLYSNDEIVDYVRAWGDSPRVLRYVSETYDVLLGGDGVLNDAGYAAVMDGMRCETAEEMISLIIEYYISEMLEYEETYGWSEEFISKLMAWREENKPSYEKISK